MGIVLIPLTTRKSNGKRSLFAVIDEEDADLIRSYGRWYAHPCQHTTYATTSSKRDGQNERDQMQNILMPPPDGKIVDHIDGFGLNNTRANLRYATPMQNRQNSRKRKITGASVYKGLAKNGNRPQWFVRICVNDDRIYLGSYKNEVLAAHVYDAAARRLFGEFAVLNFPDILPEAEQIVTAFLARRAS